MSDIPFEEHIKNDTVECIIAAAVREARSTQHTDDATFLLSQQFLCHTRFPRFIKIPVVTTENEHKRNLVSFRHLINRYIVKNDFVCPDSVPAVSGILCQDSTFTKCFDDHVFGDALGMDIEIIRFCLDLICNILKENFDCFVPQSGMVLRDFIKALSKNKIPRVANFVISHGDNSSPPVPIGWCPLVSQNFINNRFSLVNGFNAKSADIHVGEFIVSGDSNIPVIRRGSSEGVGSDVVCRNVTIKFRGFRVNFCLNAPKIVGAVAEEDNISRGRWCPRLIRVRQKIFDRFRADTTIPVRVVDIVSFYNLRSIATAAGCFTPSG